MTCDIIATGSHGNAVLLNGAYLMDCGVPFKMLKPIMKKIRLVFLTHIHSDHFNPATIGKLHRERPTVLFVCCRNLVVPLCSDGGVHPENVVVLTPGEEKTIRWCQGDELTISAFPLIHNVENFGYIIRVLGKNPGTALYATDTQYIPIDAPALDLYMVECNYKGNELQQRKARKLAAGQFSYEDTVAVAHMSFETVMEWLSRNAVPKSNVVFLHQHIEKEVPTDG